MCNITRCCTDVCPEHIQITDNGIIPMKERVVDRFYDPLMWLFRKITGSDKKKAAGKANKLTTVKRTSRDDMQLLLFVCDYLLHARKANPTVFDEARQILIARLCESGETDFLNCRIIPTGD